MSLKALAFSQRAGVFAQQRTINCYVNERLNPAINIKDKEVIVSGLLAVCGEFMVLTGLPGKPNSPFGPGGPVGPC